MDHHTLAHGDLSTYVARCVPALLAGGLRLTDAVETYVAAQAALSLTLKGTLGGIAAMLTIRGQSPAEFKRHLESIKGLLDAPQPAPQAASQGEGYCHRHQCAMQENVKEGRRWFSHRTADGQWCKGR